MAAVLRNFRIGEFWHGKGLTTPAAIKLFQEVDRLKIKDRQLSAGRTFEFGGAKIAILWPPEGLAPPERPSSGESLVMKISAPGGSALLTGDLDAESEAQLVQQGVPLESQLLKVSAHGARGSSSAEFLEKARPSIALITQGSGRFGDLPNTETLERLSAAQARVFRTDRDGALTLTIQQGQATIQAWEDSAHR